MVICLPNTDLYMWSTWVPDWAWQAEALAEVVADTAAGALPDAAAPATDDAATTSDAGTSSSLLDMLGAAAGAFALAIAADAQAQPQAQPDAATAEADTAPPAAVDEEAAPNAAPPKVAQPAVSGSINPDAASFTPAPTKDKAAEPKATGHWVLTGYHLQVLYASYHNSMLFDLAHTYERSSETDGDADVQRRRTAAAPHGASPRDLQPR